MFTMTSRSFGAPAGLVLGLTLFTASLAAQGEVGLGVTAVAETPPLDFEAAARYSADNQGLAVLVYHKGALVFEEYQNGHTAAKAHHLFSGTKSFAPLVALRAEGDGLLDLDERACETIVEWKDDPRRSRITIRQLLNFTSGLKVDDDVMHAPLTRDKYAAAIACEAASDPGKRFRYGSCHLMAFGELLERKLQAAGAKEQDFVAYLQKRILDPIGCKVAMWLRDGKQNPALPYGAFMTAREWAKFGLLVLAGGRHEGREIVPAERFAECFAGTKANPAYGLNFWLIGKALHALNPRIPADVVAASGMYQQHLYVLPAQELVIVRFGKERVQSRFGNAVFLGALFREAPTGKQAREAVGKD